MKDEQKEEGWRRGRDGGGAGGVRMKEGEGWRKGRTSKRGHTHTQSAVIKPGTGIDRDCRLS